MHDTRTRSAVVHTLPTQLDVSRAVLDAEESPNRLRPLNPMEREGSSSECQAGWRAQLNGIARSPVKLIGSVALIGAVLALAALQQRSPVQSSRFARLGRIGRFDRLGRVGR